MMTPQEWARYVLDNANYPEHVARLIMENPGVAEKVGNALEAATHDPDTRDYKVLTELAASYIRKSEPIPLFLRDFAAMVITGGIKPSSRKGRPKTGTERDFALWAAVEIVTDTFGMQKYSNGLSASRTAAEIVAEVANVSIDVVMHALRNHQNFIPPMIAACPPDWGQ